MGNESNVKATIVEADARVCWKVHNYKWEMDPKGIALIRGGIISLSTRRHRYLKNDVLSDL